MSGSGIINHPLRDEPALKTKKVNHHSSEYNSPTTHVRQGSWATFVTRCMCEHSRKHSRVNVQQETSYLHQPAVGIIQYWKGMPHLVLISILLYGDTKNSSKKFLEKIPRLEVFELFINERFFVCVCVCFLPIHSGHQWTYQPGSHRRKVTQDFSSTFFLRCVPLFFSREGFSHPFPSSTVKSSYVY